MTAEPGYSASSISVSRKPSHDLVLSSNGEYIVSPPKYISNLSNGTDTYAIKDAEARTAIAGKQDTLVSGTNIKTINNTSILGSGNISISTGDYDNETITKNGDNELQTVAIVNPNTNSGAINPLKIWNGTEQQWNNEKETYFYYEAEATASGSKYIVDSTLGSTTNYSIDAICYGKNKLIAIGSSCPYLWYSSNFGQTWTRTNFRNDSYRYLHCNGDTFLAITNTGKVYSSTSGISNWTQISSLLDNTTTSINPKVIYKNNQYIAVCYDKTYISDNNGTSWTTFDNNLGIQPSCLAYNDNIIIATAAAGTASNIIYFSEDNGINWTTKTLPDTRRWNRCIYGNGIFVVLDTETSNSGYIAYSTDNCNTWQRKTFDSNLSGYWNSLSYGDGIFLICRNFSTNNIAYSTDNCNTWKVTTLGSNITNSLYIENGKFFGIRKVSKSNYASIINITTHKCYVKDNIENLSTSSTVYLTPNSSDISQLSITSVNSNNNTITLSDTYTYHNNTSHNYDIYGLGNIHPDWICNINNVGVKIGNTTIATDGSDLLPSQSGNNGKFLTTNGSSVSWATVTQPSIATTSVAGLVKPDGTSITIDANGTISASAGAYALVIVDYTAEEE